MYSENGNWNFPVGSVLVKHFELPINENDVSITKRLETRFSIKAENGNFYFATYKWNDEQTDAELLDSGLDESINIAKSDGSIEVQNWRYPSTSDCTSCHNSATGGAIGARTRYLNKNFTYPKTGISANQLVTLSHLGILDQSITDVDTENLLTYKSITDPTATIDEKARSYMDINCAYCHQPGTGNRADFDLRMDLSLRETNLLTANANESLGIPDEKILAIGNPDKSILYHRMNSVVPGIAMPAVAKNKIDAAGVALINEWIGQLTPEDTGIAEIEEGIYTIESKSSGKLIEVVNNSQDNGANVQQWSATGNSNQQFEIEKSEPFHYTIKAVHSNKYLDVANGGQTPGTNVWQYEGNGTDAQEWSLIDAEDGYYHIVSKVNDQFLDLNNASNLNGENIKTWPNNGNDAQQWKLKLIQSTACAGPIIMEIFNNVDGTSISQLIGNANFPNQPSDVQELDSFSIASNTADNYGVRVKGVIKAPETGTYYFWITGDDNVRLSIASDAYGTNLNTIAYHDGWSRTGEWDKYPTQKSNGINLISGELYYIEALMNENLGGDNLSVGWRKPNDGNGAEPIEILPCTIFAEAPPETISVTGVSVVPEVVTMELGTTLLLNATVAPANADNLSINWSSNNSNLVSVNDAGLLTALGESEVIITATTEDGNFTASTTVTVTSPNIDVTGVEINPTTVNVTIGETTGLAANIFPQNATNPNITWSSSDESIATVNSNGLITAIEEGTAIITATTNDGNFTANTTVTVTAPNIPVIGIDIDPEVANLTIGETVNLNANISPQNATNLEVTWSSSDITIATVDANGTVLAQDSGVATISAITSDGAFEDTSTITIEMPSVGVTGVTLDQSSASLEIGQSVVLTATVTPEDATNKTVQWTSSDETIATVNNNGQVFAVSEGTTTITVTTVEGAYTADFVLTVDSTNCSSTELVAEYNINGQAYLEANGPITLSEGDWLILSVLPNDGAFSIIGPNGNEKPMDIEDLTLYNFSNADAGTYTFTTEEGCVTTLEVLIDSTPTNCSSVGLIPEYNINGQDYIAGENNGSIAINEGDWIILSVLPNDGAFTIEGPNGNNKPMNIEDLTLYNFSEPDSGIYTFTTEDGCSTTLNISIEDIPLNCATIGLVPEYNINGQDYLAGEDGGTLSLNQGDWIILSVLPNDGAFAITGPNNNNKPLDIQDLTIFDFSESDTGTYTFTTENGCTTSLNLILENTPLDCASINLVPEYNVNGQAYLEGEDNGVLSLSEGDWIILSILPNEEGAFSVSGVNGNNKPMSTEDMVIFSIGLADAGDYLFTTENGCTTTLTLQVEPNANALRTFTPLTELEQITKLSVFPNPSNGMVTIDLRSLMSERVNITVYNPLRKLVHQTEFTKNHNPFEEVNLAQLSDGVYYILFQTENKVEAKSIIIKK